MEYHKSRLADSPIARILEQDEKGVIYVFREFKEGRKRFKLKVRSTFMIKFLYRICSNLDSCLFLTKFDSVIISRHGLNR